jgi:uncharacterized protein (DUF885 family)
MLFKQTVALLCVLSLLCAGLPPAAAQGRPTDAARPGGAPAAAALDSGELDSGTSELRASIERYVTDRGSLTRSLGNPLSPVRAERLRKFNADWLARLLAMNFEAMSPAGRVDFILFRNYLEHELRDAGMDAQRFAEMEPLLPFARELLALEDARRQMEPLDPARAADQLNRIHRRVEELRRMAEAALRPPGRGPAAAEGQEVKVDPAVKELLAKKHVVNRAVAAVGGVRAALRSWNTYYAGYDPLFTWWAGEPYRALDRSLEGYAAFLRERVLGIRGEGVALTTGGGPGGFGGPGGGQRGAGAPAGTTALSQQEAGPIIGDPIGREALLNELAYEMIPYTPEELIAIARKEMAWCEAEMIKASREMGFSDDWKKALEKVKTLHVPPGEQPKLIRELALEAIEFVEKNNLVSVPPLARDSWRMEMMTPERQLVAPFFLGGEVIQVSYPTSTMSHEAKLMSMRGNNIHFSRATVHHELIPGHHLQGFMTARYRPYRGLFSTPFWGEGWALYWELLLWDLNFPKSPENRVGMLFWRMHRCARIIFSLSFHLGQMTPEQCVDLLVNQVGHERDNATAEVRRSFGGQYGPLYQAAYLLGGMQFYALQKELVGGKKMTNRQFHDAILRENRVPVEMVRAILTKQALTRDFKSQWKFYGPAPAP